MDNLNFYGQGLPSLAVIVVDRSGQSVRLTPIKYGFGGPKSDVTPEDDWLVVEGEVVSAQGTWTFQDSALLAAECPLLGKWLLDATHAKVPPTGPDDDPTLTFLEPSLAFSVTSYGDHLVRLRVHLGYEAAPPWQDSDEKLSRWTFFVELAVDIGDLEAAAADWNREAEAFPPRTPKR